MTTLADPRPRVRIRDAAVITGLPVRTLQDKAARGLIPGARKSFGRWTFDAGLLKRIGALPCPTPSRKISFGAVASSGHALKLREANIASAYEHVLSP